MCKFNLITVLVHERNDSANTALSLLSESFCTVIFAGGMFFLMLFATDGIVSLGFVFTV